MSSDFAKSILAAQQAVVQKEKCEAFVMKHQGLLNQHAVDEAMSKELLPIVRQEIEKNKSNSNKLVGFRLPGQYSSGARKIVMETIINEFADIATFHALFEEEKWGDRYYIVAQLPKIFVDLPIMKSKGIEYQACKFVIDFWGSLKGKHQLETKEVDAIFN